MQQNEVDYLHQSICMSRKLKVCGFTERTSRVRITMTLRFRIDVVRPSSALLHLKIRNIMLLTRNISRCTHIMMITKKCVF